MPRLVDRRSWITSLAAIATISAFLLIAGNHPIARAAAGPDAALLLHDTRVATYRSPFGAVRAGARVTLRLRTAAAATSVTLLVDLVDQSDAVIHRTQLPMVKGPTRGRTALWSVRFTPRRVAVYLYRFLVAEDGTSMWYASTPLQEGGLGAVYKSRRMPEYAFELTSYAPGFQAPSWARDAVIYQIFPDRFYDGDASNNATVMDPIYDNQHPVLHVSWSDKPQGGFDFFGGDLQGIIDKIPYLKSLGVNTVYLNPIFLAPSNHKYDTSDYFSIDPHFGTLATFQQLISTATANGMRVILDGVFNHTGSDSIYFNRYGHFHSIGAYQSKDSPYYPWYTFVSFPDSYNTFGGFDSLPQLNESMPVQDFIFRRPDSVAQHWLAQGAAGWRLDAATLKSHRWWKAFRQSVKTAYPDSILIAEADITSDLRTPWLLGDEFDGVMNYRFADALLGFFGHGRGLGGELTSSTVTGLYNELMSMVEQYPLPALYSSMNLVDSHDTGRVLTALFGDTTELKQLVALQMTWLGAPTIYYGDEAGLQGGPDPDDRRTFPWDHPNTDLQAYYRKLIGIRSGNVALRDGAVHALVLDNRARVFGFSRSDRTETVAIIINDGGRAYAKTIKVGGLKKGDVLTDVMTGTALRAGMGTLSVRVAAHATAIYASAS